MQDKVKELLVKKKTQVGNCEDHDGSRDYEMERDVIIELMGPDISGRERGYGRPGSGSNQTTGSRGSEPVPKRRFQFRLFKVPVTFLPTHEP